MKQILLGIALFIVLIASSLAAKKDQYGHPIDGSPSPSIFIFVSFSMPEQSLEAYLQDAAKVGAHVVIRGLEDNSFQHTFKHIAKLVKAAGGNGVELNPLWFKRFGIHTVPAVVVFSDTGACQRDAICSKEHDFDVINGDIPLAAALRMIRDKGNAASEIAGAALKKLQGE